MHSYTNKSNTQANDHSSKSTPSPGLNYEDNRPEALAQKKLQEIADNSEGVKQLKKYQQMADSRLHKKNIKPIHQNAANANPIQRKLIYASDMEYLKYENVVDTNPTVYKQLVDELETKTSEEVKIINSSSDGAASYSPDTKEIKTRAIDPVDRTSVARQIASLSHEMSHARDHLILGTVDTDLARKLGEDKSMGSTNNDRVIMLYKTELKAWKNEAIQILRTFERRKIVNAYDKELVDSFLAGADDIKKSATNKVTVRIANYRTEFGIGKSMSSLIQLIEENTDFIKWIEQVRQVALEVEYA